MKNRRIQIQCLECGRDIIQGRSDRKFCCDACKNRWHNKHRYPLRVALEASVLLALDRNHTILSRLARMGVTTIDLVSLMHLGYNINYITSYRKTGHRQICTCFDYQYELTASRIKNLKMLVTVESD